MIKNRQLKKICVMLCLIGIVSGSVDMAPKTAHAQWTVNINSDVSPTGISNFINIWMQRIKEYVLDGLAWHIAKLLVQQITASVVNWINSGFQGSPAFVTNPAGFFQNVGDQVTGDFIANTGILSGLCSPFNIDVRLALALDEAGYTQSNAYTCTLNSVIQNVKDSSINGYSIQGFTNGDFSQGGWPAFIAVGEPQNNESGVFLQAQSDLLKSIGDKQGQAQQQLLQGSGFLSWQDCTNISSSQASSLVGATGASASQFSTFQQNENNQAVSDTITSTVTGANGPDSLGQAPANPFAAQSGQQTSNLGYSLGTAAAPAPSQTFNVGDNTSVTATPGSNGNVSYQDCETKTPGSVINAQLEKSLGSGIDQLNLANSINEVVDALLAQLVNQILQQGLGGASEKPSGETQSYIDELSADAASSSQFSSDSQNIQGALGPYVEQAQQYQSLRQQAVSYISAVTSDYQTAEACFQSLQASVTPPLSSGNQAIVEGDLAAIQAAISTKVAPVQAQYQAKLDQANEELSTVQSAASQASNIVDTTGLQDASANLQGIVSGQGPTQLDIQNAQTDLQTAQTEAQQLDTAAKQYQQECTDFSTDGFGSLNSI